MKANSIWLPISFSTTTHKPTYTYTYSSQPQSSHIIPSYPSNYSKPVTNTPQDFRIHLGSRWSQEDGFVEGKDLGGEGAEGEDKEGKEDEEEDDADME